MADAQIGKGEGGIVVFQAQVSGYRSTEKAGRILAAYF